MASVIYIYIVCFLLGLLRPNSWRTMMMIMMIMMMYRSLIKYHCIIPYLTNARRYYASVSCPSLLCISFMSFVIMHQFHVFHYYAPVSCPSLLCISFMPFVIMHQFHVLRYYASVSCPSLLCITSEICRSLDHQQGTCVGYFLAQHCRFLYWLTHGSNMYRNCTEILRISTYCFRTRLASCNGQQ